MREVIVTGKTVEDAVLAGCQELGVSRDDLALSYEVLEMPVKKLFKSIPAKVKVMLEEEEKPAPAPVVEKAPEKKEEPAAPAVQQAAAPEKEEAAPAPAAEEQPEESEEEIPLEIGENPKVSAAVEYLKTVFAAMGVEDVTFTAAKKGEATIIHVTGNNVSVLIGRRGETMESLSYLASLVANRLGGDYIKLGLDVAGYRDKREKDLEALARRMGQKVLRTGRSFAMEPMNPYERRILHSAIGKMEGLRSESKGEGPERRVVIYSTAPNARPDRPDHERKPRQGGRSGGRFEKRGGGRSSGRGERRGPRPSSVPGREFADRPRDPKAEPMAPVRTERINDAEDFALFGKIEL